MPVGVMRVGEVGFSEKVVLVLPAIEVGAIKVARLRHQSVCHQGLECRGGAIKMGTFKVGIGSLLSRRVS